MVRAGALLTVAAFFIPQFDDPSIPGTHSPYVSCLEMAKHLEPDILVINLSVVVAPVLGGLLVFGLWWPAKTGQSVFLRWALVVFFILWAFLAATMGSILATVESAAGVRSGSETASTLLLFVTPLGLVTVVLARLLGGSGANSPRNLLTAAFGILLVAWSVHALQSPLSARWGPGAWAPVTAGGLIAVGTIVVSVHAGRAQALATPAAA